MKALRRRHRETLAAFVRHADKGTLSRLLVEATILLEAARLDPICR